jgi:hypothetical protein
MTSLPQHRSVQGRRPSVGPTTVRRRPSVRRRPGAGFLPAWRPAARVGAPRARFRVYGEDEYFAESGRDAELARDGSGWPVGGSAVPPDVAGAEGVHGLRIAAAGALIAGAGALGVVLALGAFATATHVRRKTALRAARANARAAGAALARTATRTTHPRPKAMRGRVRRLRPATAAAMHALPVRRSAPAGGRSSARPSTATPAPIPRRALPRVDGTVGAPPVPTSRDGSEGSPGQGPEMVASSDTSSRQGSGEFGFER